MADLVIKGERLCGVILLMVLVVDFLAELAVDFLSEVAVDLSALLGVVTLEEAFLGVAVFFGVFFSTGGADSSS
jgi:hypothetical protein